MTTSRSTRWLAGVAVALAAAMPAAWLLAAGRADYVGGAVRSPVFVRCGLIAAACVLALMALGAYLFRAGRRGRAGASFASDETGTAMVEFTLVFPVAMAVMLILIQAMLMMTGTLVINYAAYAAARTAIVTVPKDLGGDGNYYAEPVNQVVDPDHSAKIAQIRLAAVVACLPAAGRSNQADPSNGAVRDGIRSYLSASGATVPGWVDNYVSKKLAWADAHTTVRLHAGQTASNVYQHDEDLTVTVQHDYNLTIPFANRLFGRNHDTATDLWWTTVTASCTLNNEGVNDSIVEDSFTAP